MNREDRCQKETRLIQDIPLNLIDPSSLQMRSSVDPAALEQLTESLKRDGQQRPIKVRPSSTAPGHYEIVFGHRTVLALKRAGYKMSQAVVEDLSDEEVMLVQHAENRYRESISDYDMARWYRDMIDRYGYTQTQLAERIGVSQPTLGNHLRMLKLEGIISREILLQLSEFQTRSVLSAPEEDWKDLCKIIEEHYEREGVLPSAHKIADYTQHLDAIRFLEGDAEPEFVDKEPVFETSPDPNEEAFQEFQDEENLELKNEEYEDFAREFRNIQEKMNPNIELIIEMLRSGVIKCPHCGKKDLGWLCSGKPFIPEHQGDEGF